jgi:general stress protein YciG
MAERGRRKARARTSASTMTVAEAGRMGGRRVLEKYGRGFYQQIGEKGGEARKGALGQSGYRRLGRLGGEAVREKYGAEFYAEIGQKGGAARWEGHEPGRGRARRAQRP